jgi:hypothetical protein
VSRARALAPALALALACAGAEASAQSLLSQDWLVLQPEIGLSYANVVAVNNDGLFPSASSTSGLGPRFGLLAGMRFGPVSFGVRGDLARYAAYDVGDAGLFVEVRIPVPFIQPFGRVGAGYAWLGDLNPDPRYLACGATGSGASCPKVSGWFASVGGGLDLAISSHFTLGAHLDVNVLNLTRAASPTSVMFTSTGDSVGLQVTLGLHAALRI